MPLRYSVDSIGDAASTVVDRSIWGISWALKQSGAPEIAAVEREFEQILPRGRAPFFACLLVGRARPWPLAVVRVMLGRT